MPRKSINNQYGQVFAVRRIHPFLPGKIWAHSFEGQPNTMFGHTYTIEETQTTIAFSCYPSSEICYTRHQDGSWIDVNVHEGGGYGSFTPVQFHLYP